MHISRGLPLISAEHEPHLPALQFQRHGEVVRLLGLDLMHGVEHDHALGHLGRVVFELAAAVASPRQIRNVACMVGSSLHLLDDLLQLVRHRRDRRRATPPSPPSRPLRTTMLNLPKLGVLVRDSPRGSGRRGFPCARSPSA